MQEKLKTTQSDIKKNIQGTKSEGKETGNQINGVDQKEERNIQPEQNEGTRIRKMRKGSENSGTTLNVPTSHS